MKELIGQSIGSYRIESLLGNGGMGSVFLASHRFLNRPAAIKVMHPHLSADPVFQARFRQEANAVSTLNHPNIVQIYDYGEQGDYLYLVMEVVPDGSLRQLLRERAKAGAPLSLGHGIDLIHQVADGLAYAHRKDMIHRDIKPDNLLLQGLGDHATVEQTHLAKVCDFGLARLAEGNSLTASGMLMGTPAYMSPEQCEGKEIDFSTDIYSLGVVLYEVATGRLPFDTKTPSEAIYKHLFTDPPPPRQIRGDLPEEVDAIILRCLAKRPENRFASMGELARSLEGVLATFNLFDTAEFPTTDAPVAAAPVIQTQATTESAGTAIRPVDERLTPPPIAALLLDETTLPSVRVLNALGESLRVVTLAVGGLTVGRLPQNDIVLDEDDVSRFHVRIDWDGEQTTITDLGSSNGTKLGGAVIEPLVAHPWDPSDPVRVGPFWLRFEQPEPVDEVVVPEPEAVAEELVSSGALYRTPVAIALDQEVGALQPGESLNVRATLTNAGAVIEPVRIALDGLPAAWLGGIDEDVRVLPGETKMVEFSINVPPAHDTPPGEYEISVAAYSLMHQGEFDIARATVQVLPVTEFNLSPLAAAVVVPTMPPTVYNLPTTPDEAPELATAAAIAVTYPNGALDTESPTIANPAAISDPAIAVDSSALEPVAVASLPVAAGAVVAGTTATAKAPLIPQRLRIPLGIAAVLVVILIATAVALSRRSNDGASAAGLPTIEQVTTDPAQPVAGQPFTIRWTVKNADKIDIKPLAEDLDASTGQYVAAGGFSGNTTLTFVATNDEGSDQRSLAIVIARGTVTPTTTAAAGSTATTTVAPGTTRTATGTATRTATATRTKTATPSPSPTQTATPSPTPSPTQTPTATPVPPTATPVPPTQAPVQQQPTEPPVVEQPTEPPVQEQPTEPEIPIEPTEPEIPSGP